MHAVCSHPPSASTSLIGPSVVKTLSCAFRATHIDKNQPLFIAQLMWHAVVTLHASREDGKSLHALPFINIYHG